MIDKTARNILKGAKLSGFSIPHFIADFGTVSIPARGSVMIGLYPHSQGVTSNIHEV
ncbi:MAG: hypothetical protein ACOC4G_13410 [Bacillota bacterium]